jgi:hypothetical protein
MNAKQRKRNENTVGTYGDSPIVAAAKLWRLVLHSMGASHSKSDSDEKVFYNETPIQVPCYIALNMNNSDILFTVWPGRRQSPLRPSSLTRDLT